MGRAAVRVLVVDDQAAFRQAARVVVSAAAGFELTAEAPSGEAALDLLARQQVELVLMDVQMPGIGGLAAAQEIARLFPEVRVILLSVRRESDLPLTASDVGAQFCAKEGFGPAELEELWQSGEHLYRDV